MTDPIPGTVLYKSSGYKQSQIARRYIAYRGNILVLYEVDDRSRTIREIVQDSTRVHARTVSKAIDGRGHAFGAVRVNEKLEPFE